MTTTETRLDGSSFETTMEFSFEAHDGGDADDHGPLRLPDEALRDEHTRGLPNAPSTASSDRSGTGRSVLYMSMSLDGFITGPDDDASQGLGRGGERLHAWLGRRR